MVIRENESSTHSWKPYLFGLSVVCHGSRHDHSRVQSVLDAFYKCVLFVLWCLSEAFTDVLQSSDRLIAQLHPGFSRDYLNLSCHQKPQSSTGPWDSMEQVRVLLLYDRKMYTVAMMKVVSAFQVSNVRLFSLHAGFSTKLLANLAAVAISSCPQADHRLTTLQPSGQYKTWFQSNVSQFAILSTEYFYFEHF